jgi:phosphatidate cytidylyltransferase
MRVVAAAVMAPATIAVAYIGGWPWAVLVSAAACLLYFEWLMIVGASRNVWVVVGGVTSLVIAAAFVTIGQMVLALYAIVAGVVVLVPIAREQRLWAVSGLCYAAAALVASLVVRIDPVSGFTALIFVFLVVWMTDIGGYFAGRSIGGPKLWPRVSPKKTWAGAAGGLILSLAIAVAFAILGFGRMLPMLLLGSLLSVVSQLGDLFESAVKRRFGVKDSSHIIPGHGGLLDRLDGFVVAIVVAALIGFFRGGLDGIGRGIMVW